MSESAIEGDIRVVLTSEDRGSAEFKSAVDNVRRGYTQMRRETMSVNQAFALQHRTFTNTMRSLQRVGSLARQAGATYMRYNILQLRVADAARTVRDAQDAVNRAFAEGGPMSEEYLDSVKRLNEVTADQQRIQQEAQFATIGMGLEFLTMAGILSQTLIPQLGRLISRLIRVRTLSLAATAAAAGSTVLPGMAGAGGVAAGAGLSGSAIAAGGAAGILLGIPIAGEIMKATGGKPLLAPFFEDVLGLKSNGIPTFEDIGKFFQGDTEPLMGKLFPGSGSNSTAAQVPGGGPAYYYNFYGYDPDQVNAAIGNGAQNAQMFTGGN